MPCSDGGYQDREDREEQSRTILEVQAIACVLANLIGPDDDKFAERISKAKIDWAEAGVTKKDLIAWVTAHRAHDRERLAREAAAREEAQVRAKALKKLTKAERKALGVHGDD